MLLFFSPNLSGKEIPTYPSALEGNHLPGWIRVPASLEEVHASSPQGLQTDGSLVLETKLVDRSKPDCKDIFRICKFDPSMLRDLQV